MSPSDHRDDGLPVLKGDKGEQAYELKKQGYSWAKVAEVVGFSSPSSAFHEAKRYLTKIGVTKSQAEREEVLELELERLDSLLNAVWDQAMTGDTKAVDSALKVINTRAKLLSLDQLTAVQTTVTNNTVVIPSSREEFIATLKLVES
jgi:hypothetical protein